jgi:late competence protein required for DNA uptake (superfamily II DNA/RNA helicase)
MTVSVAPSEMESWSPSRTKAQCSHCEREDLGDNGYFYRGRFYCDKCVWLLAEAGEFYCG